MNEYTIRFEHDHGYSYSEATVRAASPEAALLQALALPDDQRVFMDYYQPDLKYVRAIVIAVSDDEDLIVHHTNATT